MAAKPDNDTEQVEEDASALRFGKGDILY